MIAGFVDTAYQVAFRRPLPLTGDAVLRAPESTATTEALARLTQSTGLDIHAGERETSLIMRWFPETLAGDVDLTEMQAVPETARQFQEAEASGGWRTLSPWGHIGNPAVATPENGDLYAFEAADMADALAAFLATRG
jgi:creatinine amidohydrolase/Fe(II)-dependent formamide hydrolase-like protein